MARVKAYGSSGTIFGQKLKELRLEYGLSYRSLGAILGISSTQAQRLEIDQVAYVPDDIVLGVADTFELNEDEAFMWVGRLHPKVVKYLWENPDLLLEIRQKAYQASPEALTEQGLLHAEPDPERPAIPGDYQKPPQT